MNRLLAPSTLTLVVALAAPLAAQGSGAPTPSPTAVPATAAERTADRVVEAVWQWNLKKAKNILDNAKEREGDTPEYAAARGFTLAADGKLADGAAQLTPTAKRTASGAAAPFLLGEVLYWQQKYSEADAAWRTAYQRARQAVEQHPTDARAQFYLGAVAARLKKFDEAERALERADELGFSKQAVLYQKGVAATLEQDWKAATDAFDRLEQLEPRFGYLFYYRGLAWGKLGRKDKMLNDLDMFVKLASSSPDAATARSFLEAGKR